MAEWKNAWTLEDYVIALFKEKKTSSDEFQLLLRIYGREKLESIWQKYKSLAPGGSQATSDKRKKDLIEETTGRVISDTR